MTTTTSQNNGNKSLSNNLTGFLKIQIIQQDKTAYFCNHYACNILSEL